jgi:hypothetical protein
VTDISISLLETAPNAGGFPFFILSPSREWLRQNKVEVEIQDDSWVLLRLHMPVKNTRLSSHQSSSSTVRNSSLCFTLYYRNLIHIGNANTLQAIFNTRDYTQEEYDDLVEPHRRSRYQEWRTTRKPPYENSIRKEVALIVILITYK